MRWPDHQLAAVLDPIPTRWSAAPGLPTAAVLAAIVARDDGDHLVFTQRPETVPHHPGQVSFPGGRRQAGEDPWGCAVRETEEEIGVPVDRIDALGALPPRLASSGFRVEVCVGRIEPAFEYTPDPREVARVFEVPLAHLAEPAHWALRHPPDGSHRRWTSPHLPWGEALIWGLTGRMTVDLLDRVLGSFEIA